MRGLTFLGTAAGMPVASVSTSILLEDQETNLLLDVAGGHDILGAFHGAGKDILAVQNIFISHADGDHLLGIVPLVKGWHRSQQQRTIYCSQQVMDAIEGIFTYTSVSHFAKARPYLNFHIAHDGEHLQIGEWTVTFFDLQSTKTPQFGCMVTFGDGKHLTFLGDEPLQPHCQRYAENADILLHEAFCVTEDAERLKPHEKNHGTALEAGRNALAAGAKKLVLFHMHDRDLAHRREVFTADVRRSGFAGELVVPVDQDKITF